MLDKAFKWIFTHKHEATLGREGLRCESFLCNFAVLKELNVQTILAEIVALQAMYINAYALIEKNQNQTNTKEVELPSYAGFTYRASFYSSSYVIT